MWNDYKTLNRINESIAGIRIIAIDLNRITLDIIPMLKLGTVSNTQQRNSQRLIIQMRFSRRQLVKLIFMMKENLVDTLPSEARLYVRATFLRFLNLRDQNM